MVMPKRDPPKKAIGIKGSDYNGLVRAAQLLDIFISNEDVTDHMIDDYMKDHFDHSKSGDARECIKSGVCCMLGTLTKNMIAAAEAAKEARDKE